MRRCTSRAATFGTSIAGIVATAWAIGAIAACSYGGGALQASGDVSEQALIAGSGASSINVAPYFQDPDGDPLTYTAVSSDTGVVRVSVSGSKVTLEPVAAGTATVTVTASDGAASATLEFSVTVRGPEPTSVRIALSDTSARHTRIHVLPEPEGTEIGFLATEPDPFDAGAFSDGHFLRGGVVLEFNCAAGYRGDVTLMFVARAYTGREYEVSADFSCR